MGIKIHGPQSYMSTATDQEVTDDLIQVWDEIPQDTIRRLIRSMPRRCREFIQARGAAPPPTQHAESAKTNSDTGRLEPTALETRQTLTEGPKLFNGRLCDLRTEAVPGASSSFLHHPPCLLTAEGSTSSTQASPDHDGDQNLVPSPYSDRSASPLTASDPGFIFRSRPQSILVPASSPTPNPYPDPATPPSCQVSVIIPSPDLGPSPLVSQCSEDSCPDLECSICFSQFNNVFRCPKMLQCKHTFCLECLARINVKSAEPNAIQCPLNHSLLESSHVGGMRKLEDRRAAFVT
ncbi:uncharacterized protein LOC141770162 [Sebastes fasciatus]|uniref:uncharacterized protein LOC141770162 n=1 Tax=Sebastes fasciatus TaxID=394691 RepID=UPI003D9F35FE